MKKLWNFMIFFGFYMVNKTKTLLRETKQLWHEFPVNQTIIEWMVNIHINF